MDVASLWIGDTLSEIEVASIRSFQKHGHHFVLFSYEPLTNVPDNVECRDARDIYPYDTVMRYKESGSPAMHANLFRYAMHLQTDLMWADLDMIALRKFDFPNKWVFGFEDEETINCAVLRLPKDSATLALLSRMGPDTKGIPPHATGARWIKYFLKNLASGGLPIAEWPFGATGPRAITHYLRKTGEIKYALNQRAFYPIHYKDTAKIVEPGALALADFTEETYGIHLWGKYMRNIIEKKYNGIIPEYSLLGEIIKEYYI